MKKSETFLDPFFAIAHSSLTLSIQKGQQTYFKICKPNVYYRLQAAGTKYVHTMIRVALVLFITIAEVMMSQGKGREIKEQFFF